MTQISSFAVSVITPAVSNYLTNSATLSYPNFLDLGGALAAFGLIFAVYQLRNPKWEIVLQIRDAWQRNLLWIFGGIGLFLVLLSVLITQISPSYLSYPLNDPVVYEILAYIFFIASPLSLMYFAQRNRGLFNKKTCRKFYGVLISGVSRSDEKWVDATLEVLLYNFNDICKSIAENSSDSEISQSARAILDVVLSEDSIVKLLTTRRLDGLQHIFSVIKKYNINQRQCDVGIPALMRNLFFDSGSFLYKHLNRKGLALSSNIYPTLFESPEMLTNFDLFGYSTIDYSAKSNTEGNTVEVFIQAVSKSIETYLKTGDVPVDHINNGIKHLSNMFGELCSQLRIEQNEGVQINYGLNSKAWFLHKIAYFFGHDYLFIGNDTTLDQRVVEIEKTARQAKFESHLAINEAIAAALYKSFEQLSQIEKGTDTYSIVLDLLHGMTYQSNLKEGYQLPFEKRMWQQIGKNVLGRYYPMVLKSYLNFIGFCLVGDEGQRAGWAGQQAEKMRRLLYIDLKPQLDRDEKMADGTPMKDALLPDCMTYEEGKFTYTMGFGRGPKKDITPPTGNIQSALTGIDWENARFID
jgi:hypothetical protein